MRRGFILLMLLLSASSLGFSQNPVKKVAIMEAVDKEGVLSYGVRLMLRSSLSVAVTHTPGYEGYDRVDMSSVMDEQNFQHTGMVSDEDIKNLGQMTGASYILVAEVALLDKTHIYITAKLLDVETAKMENTVTAISGYTAEELEKACADLAAQLFGIGGKGNRTYSAGMSDYEKRAVLDNALLGTGRNGKVSDADVRQYLGSRYFEYQRYKKMEGAGIALVCSGSVLIGTAIGFLIGGASAKLDARRNRQLYYRETTSYYYDRSELYENRATLYFITGGVLSGSGAALSATGIPLMIKARNKMKGILQEEQERRTAPVAELTLGPQNYGTGVALRF